MPGRAMGWGETKSEWEEAEREKKSRERNHREGIKKGGGRKETKEVGGEGKNGRGREP